MVGIFSKFSVGRNAHRRTQSALDERQTLPANVDTSGTVNANAAAAHGIEIAVEFKPVDHPIEPLDKDQPIRCPQPEPSILNDGRLWKKRVSATVRRRADLPTTNPSILPSISAPEHSLIKLLEECNASGI